MAFVGEAAEEVQEQMVELCEICDGRRATSDTKCPSFVPSVSEAAVEVQERMMEHYNRRCAQTESTPSPINEKWCECLMFACVGI